MKKLYRWNNINISSFTNNLSSYVGAYNPSALFAKIKKFATKAGIKVIYAVLILYYATFDRQLPFKERMMVAAALGYFIIPLDLLPDSIPLGFADDAAAITYVLKHIWHNLSPETFEKAKNRLHEWFGSISDADLILP